MPLIYRHQTFRCLLKIMFQFFYNYIIFTFRFLAYTNKQIYSQLCHRHYQCRIYCCWTDSFCSKSKILYSPSQKNITEADSVSCNRYLDQRLHHMIKTCNETNLFLRFSFIYCVYLASANVCNVMAMRSNELIEGVELVDDDGNVKGTSKIAAKRVRKIL